METLVIILVVALIVCLVVIRYQIGREKYLLSLNNENSMESSNVMLEMKEEIIKLRDEVSDKQTLLNEATREWNKCFINSLISSAESNHKLKKQIKLLTQQRNGYKGKVVQVVNENKRLKAELKKFESIPDVDFEETEALQSDSISDEWPEIDITKVLVKPETRFTYKGVKHMSKADSTNNCSSCCFLSIDDHCGFNRAKCIGVYFTKP